jgi:putative membrane protein
VHAPLSVPLAGVEHLGDVPFGAEVALSAVLVLVVALMVGAGFLQLRHTGITLLAWLTSQDDLPETEARKILAERLARGDISTEDFFERASILNWTPGVGPDQGTRFSSR